MFGGDCVTPRDRAAGLAAIAEYESWRSSVGPRDLPVFRFVPMGGTLFADLLPPGYMDHNAASGGFFDYSCGNFTYDGHAGTDIGIHTFDEQLIGVPVLAAADGVVVYSHDGEDDMSTCLCGQAANALIVDHGGNRYGWYWHFRKNTVAVGVGATVIAGQELGLAGSSGNSAGPHLHFGVALSDGTPIDPFNGPCSSDASLWENQPALNLTTYIADFGYMVDAPWNYPGYPHRYPNTGQMGFDQFLWFWMQLVNLPPNSTWRQHYIRPDGTEAFDSGNVAFGNSDFYRVSHYWFYHYYLWEMRTIAGTWKIRFEINGQPVITAPVEVRETAQSNFNRAPAPITTSFDPADPMADDVLFCRVGGPLALDDLDYDLVRYHFLWKRNGVTIRQRTVAGRADAFPRNSFVDGDVIECIVTPNDGHVNGTPSAAQVVIGGCPGDVNHDGFVNGDDYDAFAESFDAANSAADFNGDGFVNGDDYDAFAEHFEEGC